jgi:pseudaminic acid synthase
MQINGRTIGISDKPYIIAEISANHNGDILKAKQLIKLAKESGSDAVKIQTYTADTMTIDTDKEDFLIKGGLWDGFTLYELYKKAHTPWDWHQDLFDYAKEVGITIFSTPFDETAVDFLESLHVPAYKVASFEMTDILLIEKIAKTNKPIIMSTGMASASEIQEAVQTVQKYHNNLVLLHCVSSYPARVSEFNLMTMLEISKQFNVEVGLSDHSLSNVAAITSVAMGAIVIEKHFIQSRADKGPDSEFSLEPEELKELCRDTELAWKSKGRVNFDRNEKENENKKFRRSIYFVENLKKGDVVSQSSIRRIRPGFGLSPKYFNLIIGRKVLQDVERGVPVSWEMLSE